MEVAEGRGAAIRRIFSKQFDVIVLNIRSVEDVDDLGIVSIIRYVNPSIPIIAVTSDASLETFKAAKEKGIFRLFVKPFDMEEVKDAVKMAAESGELKYT